MKRIVALHFETSPDLKDNSARIRQLGKHGIDMINWPGFTYKPGVEFAIAWSENCLHLYFSVKEDAIMALTDTDNGPVWKDSCVEFFVSPDSNDFYYNFEFNCIGACLLAYGNSRQNREFAPSSALSEIRRLTSLERKAFPVVTGNHSWDLYAEIPAIAFFKHPKLIFREGTFKANFYKCGDSLPVPHYLTWNPVNTREPDYHRPEFFGDLVFGK
jgi:hypothetical protein